MTMNLQTSKSILAKLLAAENITISHQNTKTAYFDLKNRVLVCPVWKDMDGALYDLLMGHEVGHALNTPEAGWHTAIHDENGKPLGKFKGFLNVIEDARIERLIKRKFPGLSKSFAAAYKDLYERDFFGIKSIDANKLNLIDRINIRYKMGAHIPVSFNDEERKFLSEIDVAETWEQVVDISRRVFDYCKKQQEEQKSQINSMEDLRQEIQEQQEQEKSESDGFDDDLDDSMPDYDQDSEEFEATEEDKNTEIDAPDEDDAEDIEDSDGSDTDADADADGDGEEGEDESDDSDEEDEETETGQAAGEPDGEELESDTEVESVTDENFRAREEELINETGEVYMIELPEANLKNIIEPNSRVIGDLEGWIRNQVNDRSKPYGRNGISYDAVAQKCVRKFNNNNNKFIMHILKEFEMRKNASDYARTTISKTGELNTNSLHNYRFTNDIFKKISVVPKGKSHGMILFLDMSGSMQNIFRNTIEQCLVLASFCRRAKIPFDVYGFSDHHHLTLSLGYGLDKFTNPGNAAGYGEVERGYFHLKHLIGSSLSAWDYRRSFNNLCIVANEFRRCYEPRSADSDHGDFTANWTIAGFGLNSTPYQQTLLASRKIICEFRANHKLDITNVIYLTDGVGDSSIRLPRLSKNGGKDGGKSGVCYIVDKTTKKKVRVNSSSGLQSALTQLVRDVTGCKHLGFYLCTRKDLYWVYRNLAVSAGDYSKIHTIKKKMREQKHASVSVLGYDKYFYILSSNSSIEEDKISVTSNMSMRKMVSAFSKASMSKKNNRALVTQFAEEIASSLKL